MKNKMTKDYNLPTASSHSPKRRVGSSTTLAKVLKHSGTEEILARYNLPCLSCPLAKLEIENLKIGEVCRMYEINLKSLLKDLNEKLK